MPTIIYNRDSTSDDIRGENLVIVIAAILLIIVLFFRFGLPALQKNNDNGAVINIPDNIQADINK